MPSPFERQGRGATTPPEKNKSLIKRLNAISIRAGSETRQRGKRLTIRFTAAEHAEIEATADRAGLAVGSHVRAMLLSGKAPRAVRTPPVDRQALAQVLGLLGRVGSNVNQISRPLNYGERHNEGQLAKALKEITELRNALMAALGREGLA